MIKYHLSVKIYRPPHYRGFRAKKKWRNLFLHRIFWTSWAFIIFMCVPTLPTHSKMTSRTEIRSKPLISDSLLLLFFRFGYWFGCFVEFFAWTSAYRTNISACIVTKSQFTTSVIFFRYFHCFLLSIRYLLIFSCDLYKVPDQI